MSYDLMVFEPMAAPANRDEFMAWYEDQTKWSEDHGYGDPGVCSAALQAWHRAASDEMPGVEYSFGCRVIYCCFAWSKADQARSITLRLAEENGVGFFDVSARNGGVWMPSDDGTFRCIHGNTD